MAEHPNFMMEYNGTWYTLEELGKVLEPIYREYEVRIQDCISGLTQYAAGQAARGREAQLPELRKLITNMAEFWNLDHDESKYGYLKLREKYGGAFDRAVAAARSSGQAPSLSREAQGNILSGLDLYAKEMTDSGGLEPWVKQCGALAEQFQEEWTEAEPQMGGMTLG